jgi:hypothetical protein
MQVERLARTIIIAAASLATVWWLLKDSRRAEPQPDSLSAPSVTNVLEPRAGSEASRAPGATAVVAQSREPLPAEPAPRNSEATETVEPLPLIAGIELPGGMWNLHAQLEREPRDVVWASDLELKLSTYFASKPELARHFALPSVVCRTSLCEIQAVGYGPRPFDTWSSATADLRDQPWTRDFRAGGIYTTSHAPNEQAVVLIFLRPSRPLVQPLGVPRS